MTCPNCSGATTVTDTGTGSDEVIRRRKCKKCGYIFYTVEHEIEHPKPWALLESYKVRKA